MFSRGLFDKALLFIPGRLKSSKPMANLMIIEWDTRFSHKHVYVCMYKSLSVYAPILVTECSILLDTPLQSEIPWSTWHVSGNGGACPLRWRHNEHDSVSNHQPHDCLLNRLFNRLFRRLFRRLFKENIKGPVMGNASPWHYVFMQSTGDWFLNIFYGLIPWHTVRVDLD